MPDAPLIYDGIEITRDAALRYPLGAFLLQLEDNQGYLVHMGKGFTEDDVHRAYNSFREQFGRKPVKLTMGRDAYAHMRRLASPNTTGPSNEK